MDGAVGYVRPRAIGYLKPKGRLLGVILRAVIDLNVVHQSLSIPKRAITFYEGACEDLAAPGFRVVTLDLNVPSQQEYFTSHIDTTIVISCRLGR